MTTVRIAELKDHLSRHLRAVEAGEEVTVTDRDRPIARIVPILPAGDRLVLLHSARSFEPARDRRREPAGWAVSSTQLLLEERRER